MSDEAAANALPLTRTHIQEWRKHRGFSLRRLARLVGLSPSRISQIEQGKEPYHQRFLERCALALGCRPIDLLSRAPVTQATMMGDDIIEGGDLNYSAMIRHLQDEFAWLKENNNLATEKLLMIEQSLNTLGSQSEEWGRLISTIATRFGQQNQ